MKSNLSQFKRRFSLQTSFLKLNSDDNDRSELADTSPEQQNKSSKSKGHEVQLFNKTLPVRLHYKIVVIGAPKVGKSSIIHQFLYGIYLEKYKKTIDEMHHVEFSVHDSHLTLDILDMSGSNEFPAMRLLSISSAQAFILVYDVSKLNTFDEVIQLRDQIFDTKANKNDNIPIVVVGNKIDLQQKEKTNSIESLVKTEWENGYVECSAKNNTNISMVFKELLVQAKVKYNLSPALRRYRRQSLPSTSNFGAQQQFRRQSNQIVPSADDIKHLQGFRDKNAKKSSCVLS